MNEVNKQGTLPDLTNYYASCEICGSCCQLTILCMSLEEVERIKEYMVKEGVEAKDQGPHRCPFLQDNNRCAVYPVRTQTCRLHNCKIARKELLTQNPHIVIDDQKPLINTRETFVHGITTYAAL